MTIRLTECEAYDTSLVVNVIEEVDTIYTCVPSAYLVTTPTNADDIITFPCSMIKPTLKPVSSFAIEFVYNNALFTSVVVVDDTLESSKVSQTALAGGVSTSIFIRYDEDIMVTDFMSGSGVVLFKFQLISTDASAVTSTDMTIRLTELVMTDTLYQFTVIREIPTIYNYVLTSYQLLVNGTPMKWDAGSNVTRLQWGVPITFNIYKGSDVARRDEGFVVLISEGSSPSIALRHQSYMVRLQSTLTDNFNYAFKIYQNQTTNLYRLFTDFNDYYIGNDATADQFRIEPPGSTDIIEFTISPAPPANVVFSLPLTSNTHLVTLNLFNYLDSVTNIRIWITKRALPGMTDFTELEGHRFCDDNWLLINIFSLSSDDQTYGGDPSTMYMITYPGVPEFTRRSVECQLFIYN